MAVETTVAKIEAADAEELKGKSHLSRAKDRLLRDRLTLIALGVVALLAFMCFVVGPVISSVSGVTYYTESLSTTFRPPNEVNILGTDEQGRDHFIRLLYGGQVSLGIAFISAFLSLGIGVSLGILTGFYGGIVDDILMWFITTLNSIPQLFLLLIVNAVLNPGPFGLILILGLLGWTGTMRLVRGETFALREREYIIAARAMGASDRRIMFQHIMPNLISIVVITLAIDIGILILIESGLSFLGFGIQPPTPSWGNMLTNAQNYFRKAPHLVFMPGILITITVLCLYVIGDGVRDALDPTITE